MPLTGRIVPVEELTLARRDEMFALMDRYYANVRRAEFDSDLAEKDWVIEVSLTASGTLCGFSTQMVLRLDVGGRNVRGLFSGDTIIDPSFWNNNPLAGLWGRLALGLIDQSPDDELCWLLICKGYKTYRFLPTFFREFYPRHDRPTPAWARARLRAFGMAKYASQFDAISGIINAAAHGARLRTGVAEITPQRMLNPDVRYFCEQNPRHASGDELCCLAPLSRANFTAAAWRVIHAANHLGTVPMGVEQTWGCPLGSASLD